MNSAAKFPRRPFQVSSGAALRALPFWLQTIDAFSAISPDFDVKGRAIIKIGRVPVLLSGALGRWCGQDLIVCGTPGYRDLAISVIQAQVEFVRVVCFDRPTHRAHAA